MTSRYVKPAERCYAPRHLVAVAVEGRPARTAEEGSKGEEVWHRAAVAWSVFRNGKWRPAGSVIPATGAELLDIVHGLAEERKGCWVVTPNAQYVLTLAGMIRRWEEEGAKWNRGRGVAAEAATTPSPDPRSASPVLNSPGETRMPSGSAADTPIVSTCILRGQPDIVRYSLAGRQFTWVSGHNWWPATEEAIARAVGHEWTRGDSRPGPRRVPVRSPRDRAALWLRAMQRTADWWRQIDGGPWAATIGGLAMSYFRHRLKPKSVLSHQVPEAREVEEKAVWGGRAQVFTLASIGPTTARSKAGHAQPPDSGYPRLAGPLEHWDIASMYPTILATQQFPVRIWYVHESPPLGRVASDLQRLGVIADVMIETETPDYPCREGESVVWPIGRFRTALAGPELRRAVEAGHVAHCFRSISYTLGTPFADAAGSLLQLRQQAKIVGDPAWEILVKSLSNAFAGKLAQRKFDWVADAKVPPLMSWGEWMERRRESGKMERFRAAGPLVWRQVEHQYKGRPLASCFAYLTAYGRQLMYELMRLIPREQLVSIDTDGLWVRHPSPALFTNVRRHAAAQGYTLRRTAGSDAGKWYGPRHYWTQAGWILAGYHEPRRLGRDLTFRDSQVSIPPAELKEGAPKRVKISWRTTRLNTLANENHADHEGWVIPTRLSSLMPSPTSPDPAPSLAPLPPP